MRKPLLSTQSSPEPDFYLVGEQTKRFFSRAALLHYFLDWRIDRLQELKIDRYDKTNVVWEMVCCPPLIKHLSDTEPQINAGRLY